MHAIGYAFIALTVSSFLLAISVYSISSVIGPTGQIVEARPSESLSLLLAAIGENDDRSFARWKATVENRSATSLKFHFGATTSVETHVTVIEVSPEGACGTIDGMRISASRLACSVDGHETVEILFQSSSSRLCSGRITARAGLFDTAGATTPFAQKQQRISTVERRCPELQVETWQDESDRVLRWRIQIPDDGLADTVVRLDTPAAQAVADLPQGCERVGASAPVAIICDLERIRFDGENRVEIVLSAPMPCLLGEYRSEVSARFAADNALIQQWSDSLNISSLPMSCLESVSISPSALAVAYAGSISLELVGVTVSGDAVSPLPSGETITWFAEHGEITANGGSASYRAPVSGEISEDTLSVRLDRAGGSLKAEATIAITERIASAALSGVSADGDGRYSVRVLIGSEVSFTVSAADAEGTDISELIGNGDVSVDWIAHDDGEKIKTENEGRTAIYSAPAVLGDYRLTARVAQRSTRIYVSIVIDITVAMPPAKNEVEIISARYDHETQTGSWIVRLSNSEPSVTTFALTPRISIGVGTSESFGRCRAVDSEYRCAVPAKGFMEVRFVASMEHLCNGRIWFRLSAKINGVAVDGDESRSLIKGPELNCPRIVISDASYDATSGYVQWSLSIEQRSSGVILIDIGDANLASELPTGCSQTNRGVECSLAVFEEDVANFIISRKLDRACQDQVFMPTAIARFASDGAEVPVSINVDSISVPGIDDCVTRVEVTPESPTVVIGQGVELHLAVYDTDDNQMSRVPSKTAVFWEAEHGSVFWSDESATYYSPESPTSLMDSVKMTLVQGGRRFEVSIRIKLIEPTRTPVPTPTFTPSPTSTSTPTPTATPTFTPIPTPTSTPTPTATPTFTPSPTSTSTPTPTATPTFTPSPTPISTPTPTATSTFTPSPTPTSTPTPTATSTPTVTPSSSVPSEPRDLSVEFRGGVWILSWNRPVWDGGSKIDGYIVAWETDEASPSSGIIRIAGDARAHAFTDLIAGAAYQFTVIASNAVGHSLGSTLEYLVPLPTATPTAGLAPAPAPTATPTPTPVATPVPADAYAPRDVSWRVEDGAVIVSWNPPLRDGGSPISGYRLSWSPDGPSSPIVLPSAARRYEIRGLRAGVDYTVSLLAVNASGDLLTAAIFTLRLAPAPTPVATPVPADAYAPRDVSWRVEDGAVIVSWNPPLRDGGSPISEYRLSWSPDGPSSALALPSAARSYEIRGLRAGVDYTVSLLAVNASGDLLTAAIFTLRLAPAPTPVATPVPADAYAPRDVSWRVEDGAVIVSWNPPLRDGGSPISGYRLSWSPDGPSSPIVLPSAARRYEIGGLRAGVDYTVSLLAVNASGDLLTAAIFTLRLAPAPTPVATPVPADAYAPRDVSWRVEDGAVIVSWNPPLRDGGSPISGYRLSWSPDGPSSPIVLPSAARRYEIGGLRAGVDYTVSLLAVNASGDLLTAAIFTLRLAITDIVPIVPTAIASGCVIDPASAYDERSVPAKPIVVKRELQGDEFALEWRPSRNGSPPTGYHVSWDTEVTDHLDGFERLGAEECALNITGLLRGAKYTISLLAYNAAGSGEAVMISFMVHPEPAPTPTLVPTDTPTSTDTPAPTPTLAPTTEPDIRAKERRVSEPDKPEDFMLVQSYRSVRLLWNDPEWDGGADIEAYTVEWTPHGPPFPELIAGASQSYDLMGLRGDEKYRVILRAHNKHGASRRARGYIDVVDTLVRNAPSDEYVGSLFGWRKTTLQNRSELPDLKIHSGIDSLFWGDAIRLSVAREPWNQEIKVVHDGLSANETSDRFRIKASLVSQRGKRTLSAGDYIFAQALRICISPSASSDYPPWALSIMEIDERSGASRLLDSEPAYEEELMYICSAIEKLPIGVDMWYAVAARLDGYGDTLSDGEAADRSSLFALVMILFGSALILYTRVPFASRNRLVVTIRLAFNRRQ